MDKEQTKDLLRSLKLVLIGIFFWLIRPNFITSFFLSFDHPFQIFGLEIIGTILIFIAVLIVFFEFPFQYSFLSLIFITFILVLNILGFFLYRHPFMQLMQSYVPLFMSLMLHLLARLMQAGMKYFGSVRLSRKWANLSFLIIFGFSLPYYIFITVKHFDFLAFPANSDIAHRFMLAMLPAIIVIFFCIIYCVVFLLRSIKYLTVIQRKYDAKMQAEAD